MRSDRVLRRATPLRLPGTNGRPRRHGGEFVFADPATWGEPDTATATGTRLTARLLLDHGIGCIPGLLTSRPGSPRPERCPLSRAP
ncbi:hypothetical protein [Nocardia sp. GAS34]